MSKTISVKKLAKDMNVTERAKLLFENLNIQNSGRVFLTKDEEEAICNQAARCNQAQELSNLGKLYNCKNFLIPKLIISFLMFKNSSEVLIKIMTIMFYKKRENPIRVIRTKFIFKYIEEEIEGSECLSNLSKEQKEELLKVEAKILEEEDRSGNFEDKIDFLSLLDKQTQNTLNDLKIYKKFEYLLDYTFKLTGFEFLSEEEKIMIDDYNDYIDNHFIKDVNEMVDMLGFLNVNIDLDNEFIGNFVSDPEVAIKELIGDEEKENAEGEIKEYLDSEGYRFRVPYN